MAEPSPQPPVVFTVSHRPGPDPVASEKVAALPVGFMPGVCPTVLSVTEVPAGDRTESVIGGAACPKAEAPACPSRRMLSKRAGGYGGYDGATVVAPLQARPVIQTYVGTFDVTDEGWVPLWPPRVGSDRPAMPVREEAS